MKNHEACHQINEVMKELRDDLARYEQPIPGDRKTKDEAGNARDLTEDERARENKWRKEHADVLRDRLTALDMAADALTR